MADTASAFLAATGRLPREKFPATYCVNAIFGKLDAVVQKRLPPHLHPLFVKLRAFLVRQVFVFENRLHINPTFKLLLSTRIVPPSIAFIAAAASTIYAVRYLYTHALDLLTNIIGVAYPAYQSIMAIEYGDNIVASASMQSQHVPHITSQTQDEILGKDMHMLGGPSSTTSALSIAASNLDKKQWLMYWAIYGVLTTADHWAGPILRLFPMYRIAKIAVLIWAQHQKYNGAAWLYDTFVRPLLPPPNTMRQHRPWRDNIKLETDKLANIDNCTKVQHVVIKDSSDIDPNTPPFASLDIPSSAVWDSDIPNGNAEAVLSLYTRKVKDMVVVASSSKS
ncbi:hypothetical protein GGI25_006418 [Coemansia spiralis]|uniref:Protein YOP1 n=2 Tax=Coemansia TaxID=4863 RepID=A0A9W8G249_9FUNG|nr:hypothetical protein EDC05_006435 [Coemansia umbellata]KAJ2618606.1 hypothetical protein GGI26_006475 [Coemansia sp. RSA 1358]KAJ2668560.1 hypothetical protein GGI25_006418 [Coemansia spiralis]